MSSGLQWPSLVDMSWLAPRARVLRLLFIAGVAGALCVRNIQGDLAGWTVSSAHWEHGWPFVYLSRYRDVWMEVPAREEAPAGGGWLRLSAWPSVTGRIPSGVYGFHPSALVVDLLLGIGIVVATARIIHGRGRQPKAPIQFSIAAILIFTTLLGLILRLFRGAPTAAGLSVDSFLLCGCACTLLGGLLGEKRCERNRCPGPTGPYSR